ncbi:MAG: flagellar filament capping protein FliD [Pseudomonadota bacterium]
MAGLSSPGIGSGLDVNSLVTQLMSLERRPITVIEQKEISAQAKLTAYGSVTGALSSLESAALALSNSSTFSAKSASVADETKFTATADSSAAAGSYNIEVERIAKQQKLQSTAFASSTDSIGTGTITFEFGTYAGAPVSFTENTDKVTKTVTIEAGEDDLASVANTINEAKIGVSASVLNDGSDYYLMLSPVDPGVANSLRISVDDNDGTDNDASGLSRLVFDKSDAGVTNMTETVEAVDALIHVDGIAITKSANIITDAISGITLNLLSEEDNVTTKLTVSNDTSTVESYVSSFVTAYNTANSMLASVLAYDANTGSAGPLQSEGTVRSIQTQLRSAMRSVLSGLGAGIDSLSDLGVSFQKDGSLKLDSTKFQTALQDPTKDVGKFFVGDGTTDGLGTKVYDLLSAALGTGGLITSRTDGLNEILDDYADRKVAIEKRLDSIEERYRRQFTSLDVLIANMTKTSNYLTQQLDNLPKIDSGN